MTNARAASPEPTGPATARLPVRAKLAYALGQTAEAGYSGTTGFVFFYYAAVLGMSGKAVGLALALAMILDAALDPLIGSATDNVRSRFGRRLPVMMVGAPLLAIAGVMMFAAPTGLGPVTMFLWLMISKMAIRGFSSLYNLPYFALGAELTDSAAERSSLVAYRTVSGIVVTVILTALAYSVFFAGPGGLQAREAYPAFGLTLGALFLIVCWACCAGIWRFAVKLPQPIHAPSPLLRGLWPSLVEVFSNRSFRTLFLSALLVYVAVGVNATLNSYAYVFAFKLTPAMIQTVMFASLAGLIMGVPLAPLVLRRMEKRGVVMAGLFIVMAAWLALPTVWALGLYRPQGDAVMPWVIAQSWIGGFGLAFPSIAYPAMLADAAEEHEVLYGVRREGLYFAGLGFANKAAIGMGGLLSGLAIDLVGFPKSAGQTVNAEVPVEILANLLVAWGPIPAALGIVAILTLSPYAITRARHEDIAARLKVKRASDLAAGRSS